MSGMKWFCAGALVLAIAIAASDEPVKPNKQPLPKGFAETEDSNVEVAGKVLAYDFEAVTIDGKKLNLVDYRGKWVFVDFFATW